MIKLENVTLVSMTSIHVESTINALLKSCIGVEYGDVKLISHVKPKDLPDNINFGMVSKMDTVNDYSYNMIYHLGDHIDTDFALIIQDDGYVVNPESWMDEFLEYDYIGAPFVLPKDNFSYRDINGVIFRVGNGGFSLRSKKLINLAKKLELEWKPFHGYYNEDGFICAMNRHIYENNGCKFAPLDIAKYFSHEAKIPEIKGITPFGFHGKTHEYYNLI
jgi:hypothetical protein|tara:strand:+ start:387 stop:1043 length:657 start_codon:yes stop_codon:yes gene_type:complete